MVTKRGILGGYVFRDLDVQPLRRNQRTPVTARAPPDSPLHPPGEACRDQPGTPSAVGFLGAA